MAGRATGKKCDEAWHLSEFENLDDVIQFQSKVSHLPNLVTPMKGSHNRPYSHSVFASPI